MMEEEQLRESACYGDVESLKTLIRTGVDVNSQHKINGTFLTIHCSFCTFVKMF